MQQWETQRDCEVNVCLIVEFLKTQFSHVADETSMFFVSNDLHNSCSCCGRKQLDRQQKWVNTFYLLVINSMLYMRNSFWRKSRSFFTTGLMWYVSAVVSRFLPKNEQAGTTESLPNIRVEVSTLQTLLTLHNCKIYSRMLVQQEQILHHVVWNTFYALIPWCVLLILWFWRFWETYNHHMVMCYWICAIIQPWLQ